MIVHATEETEDDISISPGEPDALSAPIDHVAIIEYTAGYPIEIVSLRSRQTLEVINQYSRLTDAVDLKLFIEGWLRTL